MARVTTIFVLCFLLCVLWTARCESLYDSDDPLYQLDGKNFNTTVYNKNHAWIIEFYSAWCGHCIRFAPTWKKFATETDNWKNVVEVGAVNCVDPENVNLCRAYQVNMFPTIKLFPQNIDATVLGTPMSGSRELPAIENSVVNFLEKLEPSAPTAISSVLKPLDVSNSRVIFDNLPSDAKHVYLIIETADSMVGRKIILDLSIDKKLIVRRALSTNTALVNDLGLDFGDNVKLYLLKIGKHGSLEIMYKYSTISGDNNIRDNAFQSILERKRIEDKKSNTTPNPIIDEKNFKGIYMIDMENSIHYALKREIGVQYDISGKKLAALKTFIHALYKYFPGRPNIRKYLKKLNQWAVARKGNLTGSSFITSLDRLQTDSEYIPEMQDWRSCRGSDPKYRGYPCSLWTLFHTLSVKAYTSYEENLILQTEQPEKVLFAIRDYVTNFFTCEVCAEHFRQMSSTMEQEIKSPKDTVLWLWQAHNKVNQRLAGDASEDPKHPKIQFPSEEDCPKCRTKPGSNETWDYDAVLHYLQKYYAENEINVTGEQQSSNPNQAMDKKRGLKYSLVLTLLPFLRPLFL